MRLKLTLSFLLIALVAIGSVVALAHQRTADEVRAYMFRGGALGLEPLVDDLEAYYARNHTWKGAETLLQQFPAPGGQHHGQGNMGPGKGKLRLSDAQGNLIADESGPLSTGRLTSGELEAAIPLKTGKETVGYLLPPLPMRFTLGDENLLLQRLDNAARTAALIATLLAFLLAFLLSSRLLRPVQALTQAARRMAEGDLGQRVPVRGNDELALLGRTFNHMAASLQEAEERRKALTADIAHELRTPLSVQRAHLEALQDGIYPLTPENLRPLAESNALLTRLVEDLRTLALTDSGQLKLERTPVDLRALLERVVERFTPAAGARSIEISLAPQGTCPPVPADPGRVEQIVGNLLSNALRHTPKGGNIAITLTCTPEEARIRVHDSGPGIPPEDLEHIFERFYRADKSRSRAEGGSGLGLTIARQLARAHGGDLRAENAPQGGAVFTLTLPGRGRETTDDGRQTADRRRWTVDHRPQSPRLTDQQTNRPP